jgi:repressor of nif and glnA expression
MARVADLATDHSGLAAVLAVLAALAATDPSARHKAEPTGHPAKAAGLKAVVALPEKTARVIGIDADPVEIAGVSTGVIARNAQRPGRCRKST